MLEIKGGLFMFECPPWI